ncbi:MAG: LysR family transcriptional regulator [Solibacillus sp.]|uniref:LysR family transcriptional regulator n=1 Tax=unclassified Solibacillus TaxID=2637870 RepID=UPI0030F80BC9
MQILQLQYFLAVAREQHMSMAAHTLNISQSSLSKTIARLEESLGVSLFDRNGKKISLNNYGIKFAEEAEKALTILENAKETIQEMANLEGDKVTISVMSSTILPPTFKSFYDRRPNVKIIQSILPDQIAKDRLMNGDLELCISNTPITGIGIEWLPVVKERLDLLVPLNHPFARYDEIDLIEAKNERFIGYKSGLESTSMFEQCCLAAGFEPNIVFEGTEMSIVLQLVNEGQGITFYPQFSFVGENLKNTKLIRIKNPDCYQMVGFAWMKNREVSYVAKQFREHMVRSFQLINELNK